MLPTQFLRRRAKELLGLIPQATVLGDRLPLVRRCTDDIWSVGEGDLYVCVSGADFDGHDVVHHAAKRGAAALVVERFLPCDLPQILTTDSRSAHGALVHAMAGDPSRSIRVVGVTGTLGKTCVSSLIASVLEAGGNSVIRSNDLACVGTDTVVPSWGTCPSANRIVDWLVDGVASRATHAVLEMSSQALAERRFSGLHLDSLAITNIRRDHLDFHGSLANYRQAKSRAMGLLHDAGAIVTSADDAGAMALTTRWHGPLLTVSLQDRAEISAQIVERCASEQTFLLMSGSDTAVVRTRIIGDSHVENCLLAAAMGMIHAVDLADIVRGLEAVECIPGRLERLEQGQDFAVFLEEAASPVSLAQAMRTLRGAVAGRLICALDTEHANSPEQAVALQAAAQKECDQLFVSGHSPQLGRSGENNMATCSIRYTGDRGVAIRKALSKAKPGDCVLIAGAGEEMGPLDDASFDPAVGQFLSLRAA